MLRFGNPPYLECSAQGVRRLCGFYARPRCLHGRSIEEAFQAAKVFADGSTGLGWSAAEGRRDVVNLADLWPRYSSWWDAYVAERSDVRQLILDASGLQDKFGRTGEPCQAGELWRIRKALIEAEALRYIMEC